MNKKINTFIKYVCSTNCPQHDKSKLINSIQAKFNLTKDRTVFYCSYFAVRFSYSKSGSFSNTVLSLSALQKYDHIPFFVVLVSAKNNNKIFLANTSFLTKISHSSKQLSMTNIKGSFNGSDIIKKYHEIENTGDNYEKLFAFHQGFSWEENFERLVGTTLEITPTNKKVEITNLEKKKLFQSIERAQRFLNSKHFSVLKNDLAERVNKSSESILIASHINNINIRGRLIEALITADDYERKDLMYKLANEEESFPIYQTKNELGDFQYDFVNEITYTDIKTKIVYLNSNPKAFNIDKFLKMMIKTNTIFLFYLIGINKTQIMNTSLLSVYDTQLVSSSVIQPHWSGRNSRGTVQFIGDVLNKILNDKSYKSKIDINKATVFLKKLIK